MNNTVLHNDIVNKFTDMNTNITNMLYNISMNKLLINKNNQENFDSQINNEANNYFNQMNQNITNIKEILKREELFTKKEKNIKVSSFDILSIQNINNLYIDSISHFPINKIKFDKQSCFQLHQKRADYKIIGSAENFYFIENHKFSKHKSLVIDQRDSFTFTHKVFSDRNNENEGMLVIITEEESKDQNYDMEEDKCENKIQQPPSSSRKKENNHITVASTIKNEITIKPLDIKKIVNNRNTPIENNLLENTNIFSCENFKTQDLEEDFTNYINKPKKNNYKESFVTKNLSPIKSQGETKTEISKQVSFTFQSPTNNQNYNKMKKMKNQENYKEKAVLEVGIIFKQKEVLRKRKMVNFFEYHKNDLNVFEMSVSYNMCLLLEYIISKCS